MQFQIGYVHHHNLFFLAFRIGLVPRLIDTPAADADAVLDGLAARDLEGFIRPALDRDGHPHGLVALRDALHEVAGHGLGVRSELLPDDADVPDRVQAVHTRTALPDEVASTVIRERYTA